MTSAFEPGPRRALLLAAIGALLGRPRQALALAEPARKASRTVLDFDAATWARLLRQGPRPAAYVFTTSYCSTCPQAFEQLQAAIAGARQPVELAAVLMDVQGPQALAHARYYVGATRIFAFDGFEPGIRQAVDPTWRNVTPYVVLMGRRGALQRCIGAPDAAMLKAWLA